ncbi:hypothetical protein JX266_006585 [Neoarthrinium moseri]|nr:hypothetical protein JX266_006585 [Neoarthrinium moseri]
MAVVAAFFIPLVIVASVKAGGLNKTLMFYSGRCGTGSASRLNLALHLLLNILSTAILASSNFFMQILNAPTRDEVIEAHSRGSWLDIGVPSWRNDCYRRLSPSWAVLCTRRIIAGASLPKLSWLTTYAIFFIFLSIAMFGLVVVTGTGRLDQTTLVQSDTNPIVSRNVAGSLLSGVLLMGKEWALMSTGYSGLRVTKPKGQQYATYRLQLPYRYSISLILGSIILHWILSNAFYIIITEGVHDDALKPDMAIAFGYSEAAILSCIVVFTVIILAPIVIGLFRMEGNTTVVGSDSAAISAACHVSTVSKISEPSDRNQTKYHQAVKSHKGDYVNKREVRFATENSGPATVVCPSDQTESVTDLERSFNQDGSELHRRDSSDDLFVLPLSEDQQRLLISQSRIKWGEVEMGIEWCARYENFPQSVAHLSFGVEEDNVQEPVDGRWYA